MSKSVETVQMALLEKTKRAYEAECAEWQNVDSAELVACEMVDGEVRFTFEIDVEAEP